MGLLPAGRPAPPALFVGLSPHTGARYTQMWKPYVQESDDGPSCLACGAARSGSLWMSTMAAPPTYHAGFLEMRSQDITRNRAEQSEGWKKAT